MMNKIHPFLMNKYTKWYYNIISKAKNRHINDCYVERHHIIPESLFAKRLRNGPSGNWPGNANDKNNLVFLTAKEHFICHLLLVKMTEGNYHHKMIKAAFKMCFSSKNQKRYNNINSRTYEFIRTQYSIVQSAIRKGKPGRKHSDETKKKLSEINKGKIQKPKSEETRKKLSIALTGRKRPPFSDKWRANLSRTSKGRISPSAGKNWWNNGTINKLSAICPGDEWILGQLKSSKTTGCSWYNNGIINKLTLESPGPDWIKGML